MPLLAAWLLARTPPDTVRMGIFSFGAPVGEATYERHADGTFTSRTKATLGPTEISSVVEGAFAGTRIARYRSQTRLGVASIDLAYASDRLRAKINGSERSYDLKLGTEFAGSLHPQLTASFLSQLGKGMESGGEKRQAVFLLDMGALGQCTVRDDGARVVGSRSVRQFRSVVGTEEAEYSLDERGVVVAMDVPAQGLRFLVSGWEGLFDDGEKHPDPSAPTMRTETRKGLRMRLRDGTTLVADVVKPVGRGPFPTIMERTPYGRANAFARAPYWASRGYACVVQDCRGRGGSGGVWEPFVNEGRDGYDAIEWVARQPWCDGKVGMIGEGYDGLDQWQAAVERPPSLRCVVPEFPTCDAMRGVPYERGAFDPYDPRQRLEGAQVPALHVSGWSDGGIGTKLAWEAMRRAGRKDQWLVYGPWSQVSDIDRVPDDARFDLEGLELHFFDTYLKGRSVGMESMPRVQAFVTGANRWVQLDGWPSSASSLETLYLAPNVLQKTPGLGEASVYTYDPAKDLGADEASPKVALPPKGTYALFRATPLERPMAVAGPFEVRLFFKSSAKDTDLFATLLDVSPDGAMRAIGQPGKLRASCRDGLNSPTPLVPGQNYTALLRPWDEAHEVAKGHRIGLLIQSSLFPRFARNLGTGEPTGTGTRGVVQRNAILTGTVTPSRITYRRLW